MDIVDLRSDTVTKPTAAMREAMAAAEVGDDVYGEDPTVNRLQALAAEVVGKEAALLVPSGTMGNLAALLAHCGRGDEIIIGDRSHTFLYEAGGVSALGGIHVRTVPNAHDGRLEIDAIRQAVRPEDEHQPPTRLIGLENTHNRCGGAFFSAAYGRQVGEFARSQGLKLHLDGARLFNAAVAQGVSAEELAGPFDSLTFCLSKGLGAPVGSVICGTRPFIRAAHRLRKQLGGGMRQAGILAAAGIVALEQMVERLAEDHRRARQLARGLDAVDGVTPDSEGPFTNMVYLNLDEAVDADALYFESALREFGVLVHVISPRRFRLVTSFCVDDAGVQQAVQAFRQVLAGP